MNNSTSVWLSALIAGIITWIFVYLDAKLFDMPKSKFVYFKSIIFVSAIVGTTVYFLTGAGNHANLGLRPGSFGNAPPIDLGAMQTGIAPF